jgi:hypothetical protein
VPAVASAMRRVLAQQGAEMFPNLFSSEAKRWILTETKLRAAQKAATSASPEQTVAFIDQAASEVAEQLSQAAVNEVDRVLTADARKKIFDEIASPDEDLQSPGAPQAPQPIEQPEMAPMAASLRIAFDQAEK